MTDTLGFPPHQGLPWQSGPPAVDGYVEPNPGVQDDPDYSTSSPPHVQLEAGYVGGSRYTAADASAPSSGGVPAVQFQGVKHNADDLIYLAWNIRFDFSF